MKAKELMQEAPMERLESSFSSKQWKQKGCSSDWFLTRSGKELYNVVRVVMFGVKT